MLFNLILETLAERFMERASAREWGLRLQGGTWVSLILFADKYWLVATSAAMLEQIDDQVLVALAGQLQVGNTGARADVVHNAEGRARSECQGQ